MTGLWLRLLVLVIVTAVSAPAPAQSPPEVRPLPTRPAGPLVGQWEASGTQGAVAAGG
jgi:hypothetical protein